MHLHPCASSGSTLPSMVFMMMALITTMAAWQPKSQVVIIPAESGFASALYEYKSLVVYFYQAEGCEHCTQFEHTFAFLPLLFDTSHKITFAKMKYEGNEAFFTRKGVEAVPEIRYYRDGIQLPAKYEQLDYKLTNVGRLAEWVRRASGLVFESSWETKSLLQEEYGSSDEIVVNCGSQSLKDALMNSSLLYRYLDINFVCGHSSELDYIVTPSPTQDNKKTVKLSHCLSSDRKYLSNKCELQIKNIYHRGLHNYGHSHINDLYHNQQTGGFFVLITNNDTKSLQYLNIYHNIKMAEDKKMIRAILEGNSSVDKCDPLFVVGDVAQETSSDDIVEGPVMNLKKFIGGYENIGWPYPYPILAYLNIDKSAKDQQQIHKYLFQIRALPFGQQYHDSIAYSLMQKQPDSSLTQKMLKWMHAVRFDKNMKPYRRGVQEQSSGDGTTDDELQPKSMITTAMKGIIMRLYREQIEKVTQYLRETNNRQHVLVGYLFIYWHNNYQMVNMKRQLDSWWAEQIDKIGLPMFYTDYYMNDLPLGITVDQLPAFVEYYGSDQMRIYQDIKNSKQIKNIILAAHPKANLDNKKDPEL